LRARNDWLHFCNPAGFKGFDLDISGDGGRMHQPGFAFLAPGRTRTNAARAAMNSPETLTDRNCVNNANGE
jgi:hypothetical protein